MIKSEHILCILIRFHIMMQSSDVHVVFRLSPGASFTYMQDHQGNEETAVDLKLYSQRWRRWLPQKQRNTDSNRARQQQEQEPDALPGPLSAEDTDNSSHIEVGQDERQIPFLLCV